MHGDKMERIQIKKPGLFSKQVAADNRRAEFDCKNEVLLTNNSQSELACFLNRAEQVKCTTCSSGMLSTEGGVYYARMGSYTKIT